MLGYRRIVCGCIGDTVVVSLTIADHLGGLSGYIDALEPKVKCMLLRNSEVEMV